MLLKRGCNEILRPDMLTALYNSYMWSQVILDVMGRSLGGIRLYAFLDFLSLPLPMASRDKAAQMFIPCK